MARNKKTVRAWSMSSSRHEAVRDLLQGSDLSFEFHPDDDSDCEQNWDTNVMGRFVCRTPKCNGQVWTSKKIAITIRRYIGQEYNARIYHQRCRTCKMLSKPELDESYEERVVYRLKVWNGLPVEKPAHSGQSKAPHKKELCEGCKHGHCKQGDAELLLDMQGLTL